MDTELLALEGLCKEQVLTKITVQYSTIMRMTRKCKKMTIYEPAGLFNEWSCVAGNRTIPRTRI